MSAVRPLSGVTCVAACVRLCRHGGISCRRGRSCLPRQSAWRATLNAHDPLSSSHSAALAPSGRAATATATLLACTNKRAFRAGEQSGAPLLVCVCIAAVFSRQRTAHSSEGFQPRSAAINVNARGWRETGIRPPACHVVAQSAVLQGPHADKRGEEAGCRVIQDGVPVEHPISVSHSRVFADRPALASGPGRARRPQPVADPFSPARVVSSSNQDCPPCLTS